MPRISFSRISRPSFDVPLGANLMKSLLENGMPVASSCNGDGVCGKCKLKVQALGESLPPPNEIELILKEKYNLPKGFRISCQVAVVGDISVDASYW